MAQEASGSARLDVARRRQKSVLEDCDARKRSEEMTDGLHALVEAHRPYGVVESMLASVSVVCVGAQRYSLTRSGWDGSVIIHAVAVLGH